MYCIKKIITSLLFFNLCISQNFNYEPDDWFIIQNTSSINTITETPYMILIGTDTGIYSHKKNTKDIFYDQMLTSDLSDKKIYFILYDENTDYYWVVHSLGISFKSSISTYWREKSFYSMNLSFASDISGLGFNNEAIWIKEGNNLISIDRFNGSYLNKNISSSNIVWSHSKYNNNILNISDFSFP